MPSIERYYSGKAPGEVTVREGGTKRLLEPWPLPGDQAPRAFSWGRDQAGAAHIAFALLRDACNETLAGRFYQHFSRRVVANFPERWTISRTRIIGHVEMMRHQQRRDLD